MSSRSLYDCRRQPAAAESVTPPADIRFFRARGSQFLQERIGERMCRVLPRRGRIAMRVLYYPGNDTPEAS